MSDFEHVNERGDFFNYSSSREKFSGYLMDFKQFFRSASSSFSVVKSPTWKL